MESEMDHEDGEIDESDSRENRTGIDGNSNAGSSTAQTSHANDTSTTRTKGAGHNVEPTGRDDAPVAGKADSQKEDHGKESKGQSRSEKVPAARERNKKDDWSIGIYMDPLETMARECLRELAVQIKNPSFSPSHTSTTSNTASSSSGAASSGTTSFLSDSLTEVERRTRTRFIPNVDGMHMLRKSEVKSDLALVRSLPPLPPTNTAGNAKNKRRAGSTPAGVGATGSTPGSIGLSQEDDDDRMDVDETQVPESRSEEDRMSEGGKGGGSTSIITVGKMEFALPSNTFVAPSQAQGLAVESSSTKIEKGPMASSPDKIDLMTAFNPPRPPESVGRKKRHRMLRWERRPADMEVDLNNYRKTVHRTRQELMKAEDELTRVERIENCLRRNFSDHLQALQDETMYLNQAISAVVEDCIQAADVPSSTQATANVSPRTRSSRSAKNSSGQYSMKDVLKVFGGIGMDLERKGVRLSTVATPSDERSVIDVKKAPDEPDPFADRIRGVGGLNYMCFSEWDSVSSFHHLLEKKDTVRKFPSSVYDHIAETWITPGDRVCTPGGKGLVLAFLPASPLDAKEPPLPLIQQVTGQVASAGPKGSKASASEHMDVEITATETRSTWNTNSMPPRDVREKAVGWRKAKTEASSGEAKKGSENSSSEWITSGKAVAPRFAVRLPYGIGFFRLSDVASEENEAVVAKYSDARLAQRFEGMMETAKAVGGTLDIPAHYSGIAHSDVEDDDEDDDDTLERGSEVDGKGEKDKSRSGKNRVKRHPLVPFGGHLLPTPLGRGGLLYLANFEELNQAMEKALFGSGNYAFKEKNSEQLSRSSKPLTTDDRVATEPGRFSALERNRLDVFNLESKILQLRNSLFRQRRIRVLNERTCQTTQERATKVESLVAEMRTDLKNLKSRLDDDIAELGISEAQAENILTSYYESIEDEDETSQSKRQKVVADGEHANESSSYSNEKVHRRKEALPNGPPRALE